MTAMTDATATSTAPTTTTATATTTTTTTGDFTNQQFDKTQVADKVVEQYDEKHARIFYKHVMVRMHSY